MESALKYPELAVSMIHETVVFMRLERNYMRYVVVNDGIMN